MYRLTRCISQKERRTLTVSKVDSSAQAIDEMEDFPQARSKKRILGMDRAVVK